MTACWFRILVAVVGRIRGSRIVSGMLAPKYVILAQHGRGIIILHILRLIKERMPRIVVLENVGGLCSNEHREFFEAVLGLLREMRSHGKHYVVDWRLLDTKYFKVPQSRERVWIVCVRNDALETALVWPTPSPSPCTNIDMILVWPRPPRASLVHALPPESQGNARANCVRSLGLVRKAGADPFDVTYIMDIDHSKSRAGARMLGCSPCLTVTRSRQGGHWITTHGRRFSTAEMLKLQNMRPDRLQVPEGVSMTAFHGMVGNSMSVNVVEAILAMLSRAAPSVLRAGPLPDPWSS